LQQFLCVAHSQQKQPLKAEKQRDSITKPMRKRTRKQGNEQLPNGMREAKKQLDSNVRNLAREAKQDEDDKKLT